MQKCRNYKSAFLRTFVEKVTVDVDEHIFVEYSSKD